MLDVSRLNLGTCATGTGRARNAGRLSAAPPNRSTTESETNGKAATRQQKYHRREKEFHSALSTLAVMIACLRVEITCVKAGTFPWTR